VVLPSKGAGAGALTVGTATGVVVVLACGEEPAESEPLPPPQATKSTAQEARRTERIVDSGVILQTSIKNEKGSFQIRDRIRDQRDRGTVAGRERTDRGALRNDPHDPINWDPRTMDGLSTDVRSDVGQVDAPLAQEVSQAKFRCADCNGKIRRFVPLVMTRRAREMRVKEEFFRCNLVRGSRYEPRAIDDCRLHFQPRLDVQTTTLKPEILDATRTLSRRPLPVL
jgi:hypothetical protein